jgi:hypothetical protein
MDDILSEIAGTNLLSSRDPGFGDFKYRCIAVDQRELERVLPVGRAKDVRSGGE